MDCLFVAMGTYERVVRGARTVQLVVPSWYSETLCERPDTRANPCHGLVWPPTSPAWQHINDSHGSLMSWVICSVAPRDAMLPSGLSVSIRPWHVSPPPTWTARLAPQLDQSNHRFICRDWTRPSQATQLPLWLTLKDHARLPPRPPQPDAVEAAFILGWAVPCQQSKPCFAM